tara:strand:- start:836 stop:1837 length:1002 start_codon:yes stop_codon:yes gene_type:complete
MRILVTGGAGFIGTNLLIHLLKNKEYEVFCLDSLSYASNNHYQQLSVNFKNNFKFIELDLSDLKKTKKAIFNCAPNKIMHLAAESHVDKSILDPSIFISSNILGTYNILESARDYYENEYSEKEPFLFHHISTDEVYGDLKVDEPAFIETTSYKPSSPYAASKAASDHLVRAWNRTYDLPTIVTNCSNNYGPFQNKEKLIPTIILKLLNNESVPIYGKGENIRDWLFVSDHVTALELCMLKSNANKTYNIGGNSEKTNLEVFQTISKALSSLLNKDYEELLSSLKFVEDRPGHDSRYAINSEKIKNDLGWSPKYDFDKGIKETISWYMDNMSI